MDLNFNKNVTSSHYLKPTPPAPEEITEQQAVATKKAEKNPAIDGLSALLANTPKTMTTEEKKMYDELQGIGSELAGIETELAAIEAMAENQLAATDAILSILTRLQQQIDALQVKIDEIYKSSKSDKTDSKKMDAKNIQLGNINDYAQRIREQQERFEKRGEDNIPPAPPVDVAPQAV